MVVKYERRLLLSIITMGLLISPSYYQAYETPIVSAQTEPKPIQATVEEKLPESSCPTTTQKLTLKFKPVLTTLGNVSAGLGIAIAAGGVAYLHDRSVTTAHECSHALIAMLGGYRGDLYVSPKFWGGAWVSHNCPAGTPMSGLIALAGPLGGITGYLAWLQIWNVAVRYLNSGNIKENYLKGRKDPLFNQDSSLLAIGGTFWGISQHYINNLIPVRFVRDASFGPLAGTATVNDAVVVQETLTNIAPFLAKAYPFLAYAGLAGLMGYGAYGLYATYTAKKQAGQPLW